MLLLLLLLNHQLMTFYKLSPLEEEKDSLLQLCGEIFLQLLVMRYFIFLFICSNFQLFILFGLLFAGNRLFDLTQDEGIEKEHDASTLYTMVFNTFVWMQLCNEINARRLDNRKIFIFIV